MMWLRTIGMGCILASTCVATTLAAPTSLTNKSVIVSFTTTIPGKGPDGVVKPYTRTSTFSLYVSAAGRVFFRAQQRDKDLSATKDIAPDAGSNWHFAGNSLVGVMKHVSGAAQMTIEFDGAGQSCKVNFVSGSDSSRRYRWKGISGITYEATGPVEHSNTTCSVREGNVFAN